MMSSLINLHDPLLLSGDKTAAVIISSSFQLSDGHFLELYSQLNKESYILQPRLSLW